MPAIVVYFICTLVFFVICFGASLHCIIQVMFHFFSMFRCDAIYWYSVNVVFLILGLLFLNESWRSSDGTRTAFIAEFAGRVVDGHVLWVPV